MFKKSFLRLAILILITVFFVTCAFPQETTEIQKPKPTFKGWKTNLENRSIELNEILPGGPPKDGIPAIDNPRFISIKAAGEWLKSNEPVISFKIGNQARAYPLQIMVWHEIVNDEIGGQVVTVTFCPLCYTAIVFDRNLEGKTYSFGVTGMLRHSDMIMFDRETESWWQQISGEGIVGDMNGKKLKQFPSQIVSFGQFSKAFPKGIVLSRETGHKREYGTNPYRGYDDITKTPFLFRGKPDERLKPMEKVIAVEVDSVTKAYPHSITKQKRVITDQIGKTNLVIFHSEGATSALDEGKISESKDIGTTGVFIPEIDEKTLTFVYDNGEFVDKQTKSRWNVFGQAVEGELKGKQLQQITSGDYFAFAWLVFKPKTEIYSEK